MPYRWSAPDRWYDWTAARVPEIIEEITYLDAAIGEWSVSVPEGTRAPPHVVAMMDRKETLLQSLRALASRY